VPALPVSAEDIKLATYNVEHFDEHFLGHRMGQAAASQPVSPR
jgi:hypothetical protein